MNLRKSISDRLKKVQDKRVVRRTIREEYRGLADDYWRDVIKWLQNKTSGNRVDPIYGKTPTERLHPGSPSIVEGMVRPRFLSSKIGTGLTVVFENTADHAGYFFDKVPAHPIPTNGKPLIFWSGNPLPWGGKSGPRRFPNGINNHPGKPSYSDDLQAIFNARYVNKAEQRLEHVVDKILG